MKSEYQYPLDLNWTTEEMVIVMDLWAAVEAANEQGISVEQFMIKYQKFKSIVKGIGEEKRLGKAFEAASGYSLYRTVQEAKRLQKGKLRMRG